MTQTELDTFKALRSQGVSLEQCALQMRRSVNTLYSWSRIHEIPRSNVVSFWTAERVEYAKQLIAEGLSASQAGRELGCSRNALLGKLHRLGVMPKIERRPKQHRERKMRQRPSKGDSGHVQQPVVIELPEEPTAETWTRLVDTADDQCRWPVSEPDHNMLCCGAKKAHDATSYCGHHYRMSINQNQPRSRDERLPTAAAEA